MDHGQLTRIGAKFRAVGMFLPRRRGYRIQKPRVLTLSFIDKSENGGYLKSIANKLQAGSLCYFTPSHRRGDGFIA